MLWNNSKFDVRGNNRGNKSPSRRLVEIEVQFKSEVSRGVVTMRSKITAGALSGLIAGVVFGMMMQMMRVWLRAFMGRAVRRRVVDFGRSDFDAGAAGNASVRAVDDGNDAPRCDGQSDGTCNLRLDSRRELRLAV
ncbi:MAG: hypothetical protein LC776_15910 [Acidobacteria bacterium]|nr:hypothetical protein [Acidobacteriota bacterium]